MDVDVDANANAMVHHRLLVRRCRGSTWREVIARKQSRLLAEFLRQHSASKPQGEGDKALHDSEIEVHIPTTLSHDLLYQIFMLLPADSLFRLQFVCKQWLRLINSDIFVESHARKSETVLISQQLSFSPQGCGGKPRSYFHFLNLDNRSSNFVESSVVQLSSVRASYNGLILASSVKKKSLIFMNPMTRKYIELPLGAASHPLCESFGIAFCREAKTYKVVHLFREILGTIGCEILSMRSRNWIRIEGPSELLRIRQIPVSIGGSLYWLSSKRGRDYFVTMNVHDANFVCKRLPVRRSGSDRLVEIGGYLGFVTRAEANVLQVWTLMGCGESRERWMKRCSIDLSGGFAPCVPVCSRRNGEEMLLECMGSHLYVYNFDRDEMKLVSEGKDDDPWFGKVNRLYIPHLNTLVSLRDRGSLTDGDLCV